MCDLKNLSVTFRGVSLNTVTITAGVGTGKGLSGCQIDSIDHSEVQIRQFREPLALQDGIDVGGSWLGGRTVRITGTVYGLSRALAFAGIAALEAVMLPASGTFGYYPLTLSEGTLQVMPQGLRVVWDRRMYGGDATDPLAVPWSVSMYAKDPNFA